MPAIRPFALSLVLFVWALLLCGTAWCADEPEAMPRHCQQALWEAQQAQQKGHTEQVPEILREYFTEHPGPKPALFHLMLGNAFLDMQKPAEALAAYEQGLDEHPSHPDLCLNAAIAAYHSDQPGRAAGYFLRAYEAQESRDPDMLYQAAVAYHLDKNHPKVLETMRRLMQTGQSLDRNQLLLWVQSCIELKRWDEAEQVLLRFLDREPGNAEYWKVLGQVRYQREEYQSAASALEIAAATGTPENKDWRELADIHRFLNAPLKAASFLEKGVGPNPDIGTCARIAELYGKAQRYDDATAWLDRALGMKTDDAKQLADLYMAKADIQRRALRHEEAMATMDTLLDRTPTPAVTGRALMLKASCAWEIARWDTARDSLRRALALPDFAKQARSALAVLEDLEPAP